MGWEINDETGESYWTNDDPFAGQTGYSNTFDSDIAKPVIGSETPGEPGYISGINTDAFAPQYGTSKGADYTYDSSVSPRATSATKSSSNPLKNILASLGDKDSAGRGIMDALLTMYAIKSMRDQQKIKDQARGYQGKVNMALKAVQPNNVPAARAYGEGAKGQAYQATTFAAEGGVMGLAAGGLRDGAFVIPADVVSHFGNGSSEAGLAFLAKKLGATPIKGKGDGMSDSIDTTIEGQQPAKVANEEALVSPEKVAALGKGDPKKGAKVLYAMMDRVRKARTGTKKQGKQIKPDKYAPGGIAGYAGGGAVAFAEGGTAPVGGTGTSYTSNLSEWAGPYVTDMLSKGQAIANQPYQAYTGQLTAGTSPLQQQALTGYQNLQAPASIGQAAQTAGDVAAKAGTMGYSPVTFGNQYSAPAQYQAGQFNTGLGALGSVQDYMNPYTQGVTDVAAREARRQSEITGMGQQAKLAQAGAFGGSRDAIMRAELGRNLNTQIGDITATGLNTAYDKALQQRLAESGLGLQAQQYGEASRQFGAQQGMTAAQLGAQYGLAGQQATEQSKQFGAGYGLDALRQQLAGAQLQGTMGVQEGEMGLRNLAAQMGAGTAQRGVEQEALAAQRAQFEEARAYPYKQLQFQQSLLQGLPISTQNAVTQTSGMEDIASLLQQIYGIGTATGAPGA